MITKPKVLVWLGAGEAKTPVMDFDDYDSVYLVEAREDACNRLKSEFSYSKHVKIVHAIIAVSADSSHFIHYSLPEFSSVSSISNLKLLYPGLTQINDEIKDTLAVDQFVKSVLNIDSDLTLVLDVMDLNFKLLNMLFTSEVSPFLNTINVLFSELQLYEGMVIQSQLIELMNSQGFEVDEQDLSDPDMPRATFIRNPLWYEIQELNKKIAKIEVENQKVKKENDQVKNELNLITVDFNNKEQQSSEILEKREAELKQVSALNCELDNKLSKFEAEYMQVLGDYEQVKTQFINKTAEFLGLTEQSTNSIEEAEVECKKVKDELNRVNANLAESNAKQEKMDSKQVALESEKLQYMSLLDRLTAELSEAHEKIESLSNLELENQTNKQELVNQCEKLKQQLNERQLSTDLTLKLQVKAQLDLDELRDKYKSKHNNEQKLIELVKEMRQKLQQAAQFYYYLEQNHPELSSINLREDVLMKNDKIKSSIVAKK